MPPSNRADRVVDAELELMARAWSRATSAGRDGSALAVVCTWRLEGQATVGRSADPEAWTKQHLKEAAPLMVQYFQEHLMAHLYPSGSKRPVLST